MDTMEGHTEWPDARLNELARRVESAATKEDVQALRREFGTELRAVSVNVDRIGTKLDKIFGDPISEDRQKKTALIVAAVAACSGVTFSALAYIISGATPH